MGATLSEVSPPPQFTHDPTAHADLIASREAHCKSFKELEASRVKESAAYEARRCAHHTYLYSTSAEVDRRWYEQTLLIMGDHPEQGNNPALPAVLPQPTMLQSTPAVVPQFDLEDYATTYRATRDAELKAANELKLATGPYKAARDAYVAATATYTKSLYE